MVVVVQALSLQADVLGKVRVRKDRPQKKAEEQLREGLTNDSVATAPAPLWHRSGAELQLFPADAPQHAGQLLLQHPVFCKDCTPQLTGKPDPTTPEASWGGGGSGSS